MLVESENSIYKLCYYVILIIERFMLSFIVGVSKTAAGGQNPPTAKVHIHCLTKKNAAANISV